MKCAKCEICGPTKHTHVCSTRVRITIRLRRQKPADLDVQCFQKEYHRDQRDMGNFLINKAGNCMCTVYRYIKPYLVSQSRNIIRK